MNKSLKDGSSENYQHQDKVVISSSARAELTPTVESRHARKKQSRKSRNTKKATQNPTKNSYPPAGSPSVTALEDCLGYLSPSLLSSSNDDIVLMQSSSGTVGVIAAFTSREKRTSRLLSSHRNPCTHHRNTNRDVLQYQRSDSFLSSDEDDTLFHGKATMVTNCQQPESGKTNRFLSKSIHESKVFMKTDSNDDYSDSQRRHGTCLTYKNCDKDFAADCNQPPHNLTFRSSLISVDFSNMEEADIECGITVLATNDCPREWTDRVLNRSDSESQRKDSENVRKRCCLFIFLAIMLSGMLLAKLIPWMSMEHEKAAHSSSASTVATGVRTIAPEAACISGAALSNVSKSAIQQDHTDLPSNPFE